MSKWTLKTLNGMSPNTAQDLFAKVAKRDPSITYARFRACCGTDLRCFAEDSRWMPGDLFRGYFADAPKAGALLVALYNERSIRPGFGAKSYASKQIPKRKRGANAA